MRKYRSLAALALLAGSFAMWGCKNSNLFGGFHDRGTGDPAGLLSDAQAALSRREYNNAKSYYESILAQQPGNSEALYGAATATMGTAGLDLGTLLANVITSKTASAPAASLSDAIYSASVGAPSAITQEQINSRSILKGVDLTNLSGSIDQIVCFLLKIRSGNADGKITSDDISVLMSVGITCIIRGILRPLEQSVIDLRQTPGGNDFEVVIIDATKLDDLCANGTIQNSITDLAGALQAIQTAVSELSSSSDSTLGTLSVDLKDAFNQFKTKFNAVAVANGVLTTSPCYILVNSFNPDSLSPPTVDPGNCLNTSNVPLH